ncbi:unnamed protein product, partial [marine sediment metagenome]
PKHLSELEEYTDSLHIQLPELKNFILPAGGFSSVFLHQSRTIVRRVERNIIILVASKDCHDNAYKYLNRLSSCLYTMARFASFSLGNADVIYQKAKIL